MDLGYLLELGMTGRPRDLSRYESLRASRRVLAAMGPVVGVGLCAGGVVLFLNQVGDLVSDMQLTWGERRVTAIVAVVTLGGSALAGWVASRLLRTLAELIDVVVDQAEAAGRMADLIEWHVVPALARVAVALERSGAGRAHDGRELAIAGVRQAILDSRWDQADRLLEAFNRDYASTPESVQLAKDLAEARQASVDDLRARLDAAQAANDPERVIEYRDKLTQHLRREALRELDRQVIAWLMGLIQRRLRTGTVRTDVVHLAERVADSFGDTAEGASLRAALPTLRRSAGLCPSCAQPYRGLGEACPTCLAAAVSNKRPALTAAPGGTAPEAVI